MLSLWRRISTYFLWSILASRRLHSKHNLVESCVTHKKEFIVWYTDAKKEETRTRRVEKMKQMLSAGEVIS